MMAVDAADSLNIAEFHGSASRDGKTPPSDDIEKDSGKEMVARAPYQPSKGPLAAYTELHQILYQACPIGWNKQREWTQSDDGLFYLYISARCR